MDLQDDRAPRESWDKTREAVANFRRLLLCSKCSKLLNEPVCLGVCEHIVCRSCAAPQIGDGCVVCHSPAWVQDIKINRQLHNITQAFCSLDAILNPAGKNPDSSPAGLHQVKKAESSVLKHKKNYKIWFSPRSRKVRCRVEKPEKEVEKEAVVPPPPETTRTEPHQDLSVYNFIPSSSQESDSMPAATSQMRGKNAAGAGGGRKKSPRKRATKKAGGRKPAAAGEARRAEPPPPREQQATKSSRLEAVNRQWGIDEEEDDVVARDEEQACAEKKEGSRRSSKRVSFVSPEASNEKNPPQPDGPQEHSMVLSLSGDMAPVSEDEASSGPALSPAQSAVSFRHEPTASGAAPPHKRTPKRCRVAEKEEEKEEEEKEAEPEDSTPKRPRASSAGQRRRSAHRLVPDVLLAPPSPASCLVVSGKDVKSPRAEKRGSPGRGSSPGSPPGVLKRNHKGETPLHLAAIKGDVEAAKELLDQGADPNLKDHAGWTPLHEACNLGHQAVVEMLVSRGALLNTPGYENDSPLHDAVTNGYPAIARLLLQHGASANVLNLHGKRPADYAVTPEMQAVFQTVSVGPDPAGTAITPPASLSSGVARREEQVVLLASKLSRDQQNQVAKLGRLLGGKKAEAFSGSVSHVVVPDGPMPTTLSTLLGVLAGRWVLRYSWVESCLQARSWIPEPEYEAGEGPQRSRINRCSLLPPLFDGCFFFLLGSFKAPPKQELVRLLREGGGTLLVRQPKPDSDVTQTLSAAAYHAYPPGSDQALCTQYILYDPQGGGHRPAEVRRGKVWSAPSSWLIDCIAAFRLLPVPELSKP